MEEEIKKRRLATKRAITVVNEACENCKEFLLACQHAYEHGEDQRSKLAVGIESTLVSLGFTVTIIVNEEER